MIAAATDAVPDKNRVILNRRPPNIIRKSPIKIIETPKMQ